MKKFTLLIIFYLIYFISFSQKKSSEKVSVEKSILSIQTGYFGTWINHELKLHNQLALRTDFGTEYRLKFAINQSFDSLKNQVSLFFKEKVSSSERHKWAHVKAAAAKTFHSIGFITTV